MKPRNFWVWGAVVAGALVGSTTSMAAEHEDEAEQKIEESSASMEEGEAAVEAQEPGAGAADEGADITVEQGAAQIQVEQPAPSIVVEQPAPAITIEQSEPEVKVYQAQPEVTIEQPAPEVTIEQPKPRVRVLQQDPEVTIQHTGEAEVRLESKDAATSTEEMEEAQPAEEELPLIELEVREGAEIEVEGAKVKEEAAPAEDASKEQSQYDMEPQSSEQVGMLSDAQDQIMNAPLTDFGATLMVGGGVTNFTQSNLTDATSVGGYWDVRGALGTRSIVGLEAAYRGDSRDIQAIGLRDEAFLVGNGLEAAVRLNAPLTFEQNNLNFLVEPFAFGGVGWSRYNLFNEGVNTSDVIDQDDIFVVPVGVGIGGSIENIYLDARFTYRPAFGSDLVGDATGAFESDSLSSWGLGAQIGFEF